MTHSSGSANALGESIPIVYFSSIRFTLSLLLDTKIHEEHKQLTQKERRCTRIMKRTIWMEYYHGEMDGTKHTTILQSLSHKKKQQEHKSQYCCTSSRLRKMRSALREYSIINRMFIRMKGYLALLIVAPQIVFVS